MPEKLPAYVKTHMINCYKCKRPVELLTQQYDIKRACTVFTVTCHGETETVLLSDMLVVEAKEIFFDEAFKSTARALKSPALLNA